jgi:putative DNA primase/helicase
VEPSPTLTVPSSLAAMPNFVAWKYRIVDGRKTKIPYDVSNGKQASTTNSMHWRSLEEVRAAVKPKSGYEGIGFVFSDTDDVIGIDIDHCVNPDTQEILPWARRIVDLLSSYTEFSPSLTGLHVFIRGSSFGTPNQINCIPGSKIEMYWSKRYFTMTGLRVDGTPDDVAERAAEFTALHTELSSDAKLIEGMKKSDTEGKTWKLWTGEWSDEYGSQSEADLALCSTLMWLCEGDVERVDRIFRYSALWRPKWDEFRGEFTYGQKTLQLAQDSYDARFTAIAQGIDPQFTDYGNALRMWKMHNEAVIFVPQYGKWFVWTGTHWKEDQTHEADRLLYKTIQSLYTEAMAETDRTRRADLIDHARRSEMGPRLRETLKISERLMRVSSDELDRDPMLLAVKNGVVDLHSGELLPHSRERMMTKLSPVTYDPKAECPVWMSFLQDTFRGVEDTIEFVQRAVGYSLTGSIKQQAFFFLYGVGSNGKSTFLTTIRTILGDYAAQADPSTFMAQRGNDGPRNDLARLAGKRMVTSVETEKGKRFSESVMKQLTGGESVTCRFLHREFFEYVPTYKIWIAGNHQPDVRGQDHGFWRRVKMVPFTVTVPDDKQDRDLGKKLEAELPGILNWALAGVRLWREKGLGSAKQIEEATNEYRAEQDVVGMFITEALTISDLPEGMKPASCADVYEAYVHWCDRNREFRQNKRGFEVELKNRGLITGRGSKNVAHWERVSLNDGYTAQDLTQARSRGGRTSPDEAIEPSELFG